MRKGSRSTLHLCGVVSAHRTARGNSLSTPIAALESFTADGKARLAVSEGVEPKAPNMLGTPTAIARAGYLAEDFSTILVAIHTQAFARSGAVTATESRQSSAVSALLK
jgi:hypothetical protein